jgi:hypothetical protein
VVFWSKENSHFRHELEYKPPHVMTSDYLIGPYSFGGPVNIAAYSAIVQMWLRPQLRQRVLMDDVWLRQDGAHTHAVLLCARHFKQTFSRLLDWLWFNDIFGTINMPTIVLFQPTNAQIYIYINSISLHNVHSYVVQHLYVILRQFYICACYVTQILKIEAVKITVPQNY